MNKEEELLHEVLDTFQKIRGWSNPDFYRQQVMPTVNKVREHLAAIETDKFIKNYETKKEVDEIPTIPSYLEDLDKLGLFRDDKKDF